MARSNKKQQGRKSQSILSRLGNVNSNKKPMKTKLVVANLGEKVTKKDVEELFRGFNATSVTIARESKESSLSVAEVVFDKPEDAARAIRKYQDVSLDERPMKITFSSIALPRSRPSESTSSTKRGDHSRFTKQPARVSVSFKTKNGFSVVRPINTGRASNRRRGAHKRSGQRRAEQDVQSRLGPAKEHAQISRRGHSKRR